MKKYKLIKEYPDSPKLGSIANRSKSICKEYYYRINVDLYDEPFILNSSEIENYPEFWEEIVEEEYEILAFKNNHSNLIGTKRISGGFSFNPNIEADSNVPNADFYLNKNIDLYSIYSIKRLSDGEIFSIGDKTVKGVAPITNIYIQPFDKTIWLSTNLPIAEKLSEAIKAKTPLFTTEDGVDIFDKDTIVARVFLISYELQYNIPFKYTHKNKKSGGVLPVKLFSTKEAAEEYILINRPILSLKEVLEVYGHPNFNNNIKKLVKSKL